MNPVWCLAVVFLLFGCSMPVNQSRFLSASSPPRQETPTEEAKTETKQDAAPARLNDAGIKSAIHASDEARELLDRRRYILDTGSEKNKER
jgi:hypothetical protein